MTTQPRRVIPIYTSRGDAAAFLVFPYLYNRLGEWIGWVTTDRQVYSVLGFYVGDLTADPRIIRKRVTSTFKPPKIPPACPLHLPPSLHHLSAVHALSYSLQKLLVARLHSHIEDAQLESL